MTTLEIDPWKVLEEIARHPTQSEILRNDIEVDENIHSYSRLIHLARDVVATRARTSDPQPISTAPEATPVRVEASDGAETIIEKVADAIEEAQCPNREGPYGLYDYSSYGHPQPHHVRDFRDPKSQTWGHSVLRTTDRAEAEATYKRLTREHIARAAILAMQDPTREMLNAAVDATGAGTGMSWVNRSPQTLFEQGHRAMIHAVALPPTD